MPGFNRKGPNGEGPRTGRQQGKCNPSNKIQDNNKTSENTRQGRKRGMRKGAGNVNDI